MKLEPNYLPKTTLVYASLYDAIVGPKAKVTFSILITSNRIKLSIYSYEKVIFFVFSKNNRIFGILVKNSNFDKNRRACTAGCLPYSGWSKKKTD